MTRCWKKFNDSAHQHVPSLTRASDLKAVVGSVGRAIPVNEEDETHVFLEEIQS